MGHSAPFQLPARSKQPQHPPWPGGAAASKREGRSPPRASKTGALAWARPVLRQWLSAPGAPPGCAGPLVPLGWPAPSWPVPCAARPRLRRGGGQCGTAGRCSREAQRLGRCGRIRKFGARRGAGCIIAPARPASNECMQHNKAAPPAQRPTRCAFIPGPRLLRNRAADTAHAARSSPAACCSSATR